MATPVGIGLIGCGTWGGIHARTYAANRDAHLVVVADADGERAAALAARHGAAASTDDWHAVLANPAVDAVAIVTPDFTHAPIVLAAIQAGKHVLVEKPLATTTRECEEILAARDAHGVKLMVDFHNRWNIPFVHVRRMVESGELGTPVMVNIRLNDTLFVPTRMLGWADRTSPAHFLGSHLVDLIRWISGAEVDRVFSVSRRGVLDALGVTTPDFFQSILELSNGGTAVVETCWILSEQAPSVFDVKAEFIGTKGSVYINTSDHRVIEAYTGEGAALPDVLGAVDVYGKPTGFCVAAIEHFIECVARDVTPAVSGEDGLAAARIVEAMDASAATGLPVTLSR